MPGRPAARRSGGGQGSGNGKGSANGSGNGNGHAGGNGHARGRNGAGPGVAIALGGDPADDEFERYHEVQP